MINKCVVQGRLTVVLGRLVVSLFKISPFDRFAGGSSDYRSLSGQWVVVNMNPKEIRESNFLVRCSLSG